FVFLVSLVSPPARAAAQCAAPIAPGRWVGTYSYVDSEAIPSPNGVIDPAVVYTINGALDLNVLCGGVVTGSMTFNVVTVISERFVVLGGATTCNHTDRMQVFTGQVSE